MHLDAANTLVWLDHAFLVGLLAVAPEESVYVGDICESDFVGARGAGMRAFPVDPLDRWIEIDRERFRAVDELPDSVAEVAP